MRTIFTILIGLALCLTAEAQNKPKPDWSDVGVEMSGSDFLIACPWTAADVREAMARATNDPGTAIGAMACMSFVQGYAFGINDGIQLAGKDSLFGGITNGKLYETVTSYIVDHPDHRSKPMRVLIIAALVDAYTKQQPSK